jgi:hypothetical protein
MANKKIKYVEPTEYIPKHIRKELKLGEFAEPKADTKKAPTAKKETKKTK